MNLREELLQRLHRWTVSTAPRPDAVGFLCSALVEGMLHEQLLRVENKVIDQISGFLRRHSVAIVSIGPTLLRLDEQWTPLLVGVIVRWSADDVLVAAFDDKQMTILYTGDETYAVIAEFIIEIFDEHVALLSLEMSAVVVFDASILELYDVAS